MNIALYLLIDDRQIPIDNIISGRIMLSPEQIQKLAAQKYMGGRLDFLKNQEIQISVDENVGHLISYLCIWNQLKKRERIQHSFFSMPGQLLIVPEEGDVYKISTSFDEDRLNQEIKYSTPELIKDLKNLVLSYFEFVEKYLENLNSNWNEEINYLRSRIKSEFDLDIDSKYLLCAVKNGQIENAIATLYINEKNYFYLVEVDGGFSGFVKNMIHKLNSQHLFLKRTPPPPNDGSINGTKSEMLTSYGVQYSKNDKDFVQNIKAHIKNYYNLELLSLTEADDQSGLLGYALIK
jgi:hypothetical protein